MPVRLRGAVPPLEWRMGDRVRITASGEEARLLNDRLHESGPFQDVLPDGEVRWLEGHGGDEPLDGPLPRVVRRERFGRGGVAVFEPDAGRHREHCLCYTCRRFMPNTDDPRDNCPIANLVFAVCVAHGIVAPVRECPEYDE